MTCVSCARTVTIDREPPRERIHWDGVWRIAHAEQCALPGWLVVIAARHVNSFAEMTGDEAGRLGPLLSAATRALVAVTGCEKTYVAMFAEREGFHHLHVHVIPRAADLAAELRGPAIFRHLARPRSEWLSASDMDRVAIEVAGALDRERRA